MERSESAVFTNMCMVRDGDRVLVINRNDPGWPGLAFPGGHVEKGEAFADSVIREVYEETGLTIEQPRLCGIKQFRTEEGSRYIVLLYRTDQFAGELISSGEGEVFWLTLEQLDQYPLTPHFEQVVEVMLRDDLSEFFYDQSGGGWVPVLK